MKGQYISLEYVLFFAIGIGMIVSVYFLFSNISGSISDTSQYYQLEKLGVYVRSGIEKVFISGNYTGGNATIDLDIPKTLTGCIYSIRTGNDILEVKCPDTGKVVKLNLYGIKTKDSLVYSSEGRLKIRYSDGMVELMI